MWLWQGRAEVARFPLIDTLDATCLVGPSMEHLMGFAALVRLRSLSVRGNYTTDDQSLAAVAEALTNLTCLRFNNAKVVPYPLAHPPPSRIVLFLLLPGCIDEGMCHLAHLESG